mmetsp:Transcript_17008/g.35490  ORF Transcript_17008/g.35490 Transcript_17008/m.35490 type:complete len:99 (-) Transcript_17008:356-652(-)
MRLAESFSKEACIAAWEAVGAVPPTRACLNDSQVRRELGDSSDADKTHIAMAEMQLANSMACGVLTAHGFQGHFLKVAEAIFAITGGDHFTSNDLELN